MRNLNAIMCIYYIFCINYLQFFCVNWLLMSMHLEVHQYNYPPFLYSKSFGYNCVPFFNCAAEQIYITTVNTVSNLAACSSPTDAAQIMSNDSLLSTSAFLWFDSNIQYPTTMIAQFTFPNESIN